MSRYARQTLLPEVGPSGQDALAAARVLVVGCGGLGAPVLPYLVGAGVGRLILVDGDVVSQSNLHRQVLFRETDIGHLKVEAAAASLHALNAKCHIDTHAEPLDPINAASLVAACDLVLDCADSFAASYILSDTCLAQNIPLISASVLGHEGYVGGFCGTAPSLRALFPDLPDRAATCATAGVMGPVVGMIGAAQAQMALAALLGQAPSPLGQLMRFDLRNFRASGFRFDRAPEPELGPTFIAAASIEPDDFVVELRGIDEAPTPVTPEAIRLSVAELALQKPQPSADQRAVLVCRSGLRSWQAANHLRSYWSGTITLISMGDTPPIERPTS